MHALTVPAAIMFGVSRAKAPLTLVFAMVIVTVFVDVWAASTFVCFLGRCCPSGNLSSALSMGMTVCDDDSRLDIRVLSLTALVYTAVQAVASAVRADEVQRSGGCASSTAVSLIYVLTKVFSLVGAWEYSFNALYYLQSLLTALAALIVTILVGAGVKGWRGSGTGLLLCALSDGLVILLSMVTSYPFGSGASLDGSNGPAASTSMAVWHVGTAVLAMYGAKLIFAPKQS